MSESVKIPRHVAVIMDGNGRWAEKNKVTRLSGHNQGMYTMKEIIKRADVLGDYEKVPQSAVKSIEKAVNATKDNTGLQFNIALNYGSRAEIARAARRAAEEAAAGRINTEDIDEEMISRYLYTGDENGNIPDPDLIIRTSGEQRLSNFLLWQAAYSEFAFTDSLWPDFSPEEFEKIIGEFCHRSRRFGGRKG